MVGCLPPENNSQGKEILQFLNQHAYIGFATEERRFDLGRWVASQSFPGGRYNGIAIILYFSDEPSPLPHSVDPNVFRPGVFSRLDQMIMLFNVDRWSIPELALALLHEARHARHRLGGKLAGLPPLDLDDTFHEENTLSFHLYVLSVWAKELWIAAIAHGIAWLTAQSLVSPGENQILYKEVEEYCPELDAIFGESLHKDARSLRKHLVSIEANTHYWASQCPGLSMGQIFHSIASSVRR